MVRIDNASDLTYMVLYPGSPSVNKKKKALITAIKSAESGPIWMKNLVKPAIFLTYGQILLKSNRWSQQKSG